jgi:hypothetical protein
MEIDAQSSGAPRWLVVVSKCALCAVVAAVALVLLGFVAVVLSFTQA